MANHIEKIVTGQQSVIPVDDEIEELTPYYGALLNRYRPKPPVIASDSEPQYEEVDISIRLRRKMPEQLLLNMSVSL